MNNTQDKIILLHWNTHWECFAKSCCNKTDSCPNAIGEYLNKMLRTQSIDFVSLLMFETKNYNLPNSYKIINPYPSGKCGQDITSIIYDSSKWDSIGNTYIFCLQKNDRMTVIQNFHSKNKSINLWVVAAHFGHNNRGLFDPSELKILNTFLTIDPKGPQIKSTDNVILMADTNASSDTGIESNENILQTVLGNKSRVLGSIPSYSCCYNDKVNGKWSPFSYKCDRILANFGLRMATPLQPNISAQEWAKSINLPSSCYQMMCDNSPVIGEMHKPIMSELHIEHSLYSSHLPSKFWSIY